jgi:hypothetical protein
VVVGIFLSAMCLITTLIVLGTVFPDSSAQPSPIPTGSQGNLTCTLISKDPNYHNVPWAYLVAIFIILVITYIAARIMRIARKWVKEHGQAEFESDCGQQGSYEGSFWDILRDGDYYPSLARFQFAIWTFIISFMLLSIYLLMLWNNTLCWSGLSQNILTLMGISAAVPIVSNVLSREKYSKTISGKIPCKEKLPVFSTMLMEHNKLNLGRFQMLLWTFVSVAIYLGLFIQQVNAISNMFDLRHLQLPDIDSSLLFLMGLSQVAYLGAKYVARPVAPRQ